MTITDLIKQGFHYARTCKSLWLFGFVVGIASGGSGGAGNGGGGNAGGGLSVTGFPFVFSVPQIAAVVILVVLAALAAVVLRLIAEGALIEGIVRIRRGGTMTMREGFRAGLAHWWVLLRIAVIYIAATVGSLVLLVIPCALAVRATGLMGGLVTGIPALVIAVPWLTSLYLIQAFATRIAVLENRHALDAMRKARLFLHGRLMHGLRLIVASFVGTLALVLVAIVVMVPTVLLLTRLVPVLNVVPVIALGGLVLLPFAYVITAMIGTLRSSIWTIGYVTQVES